MSAGAHTTAGGWRLLAASSRGTAHVNRNLPNQDAWLAATRLDGSVLLAAADGAGTAERSDEGARTAVRAAIAQLAGDDPAADPEGRLRAALDSARLALSTRARREGRAARHYACTLLLAVIGPRSVAGLQLGDGAVVVREAGGGLRRLTQPWPARFAGETVFLTSSGAQEQADFAVAPVSGLAGIALLTDGLEHVATNMESGEPFPPFFLPLFDFTAGITDGVGQADRTAGLARLLGSERIRSRTHDDTTLLLAARPRPETP